VKTLEAWYCIPPEREDPIIQIALAGSGPICGEVRREGDRLVLEVYPRGDTDNWLLPVDELCEILRRAEGKLLGQ
jgi:hypothetical protein